MIRLQFQYLCLNFHSFLTIIQIFESPQMQEIVSDQYYNLFDYKNDSSNNIYNQYTFKPNYPQQQIQDQNTINQFQNINLNFDDLQTPKQKSIITDTKLVFNVIYDFELADLLNKTIITMERDTQLEQIPTVKIYDCRWPYEYNGGHIKTSVNMYDGNIFKNELQNNQDYPIDYAIFYCEYSQVRARKMYQYCEQLLLSGEINTQINQILLLQDGYNNFYEKYPNYVDGGYIQERSNLQLQKYYSHQGSYDMNIHSL